jgi:hypothetical protein
MAMNSDMMAVIIGPGFPFIGHRGGKHGRENRS